LFARPLRLAHSAGTAIRKNTGTVKKKESSIPL
jgi:hypothetical protein